MKKFTLFIALIAFMVVGVFGQETVYTVPSWDASKVVHLCDGGSFIAKIDNSVSGKTYTLAIADAKGSIESIEGDGGTISFTAQIPVSGSSDYSVVGDGFSPFISLKTNVVAQPTAPTMTKSPTDAAVCAGTDVSASIASGGSSGVSGCSDSYKYSTNGGSAWSDYTPGDDITTTGAGTEIIQIRAIRSDAEGRGCSSSNTYTWTVNALPDAPSANNVNFTYDGISHTADASIASGESIVWYDAATSGNVIADISTVLTQTNVGVYSAWAEAKTDATGCISTSRTQVTLTISKANLNVTAVADDIDYGIAASVTIEYSGFQNGEDETDLDNNGFTIGTVYSQGDNIGTYVRL